MPLPLYLVNTIEKDLLMLTSPQQMEEIKKLCFLLPDFNKVAFEFDLLHANGIDFHLNLKIDDNVDAILQQLKQSTLHQDEKWKPLLSLMERWLEEKHILNRFIEGMYLEFDTSVDANELSLPSTFFKISSKRNKSDALQLSKEIITSLKGETFYTNNQQVLEACIFNGPNGSYLGYLGLMLSRPIEVVRVNLHNVPPNDLLPFLKKWGWTGNELLVQDNFNKLVEISDNVILSFDVYKNQILPRIGIEAFILNMPYRDPRWDFLLSWYVKEGLCSPESKNIVTQWNRTFFPFDDIEWHEALILNSLDKHKEQFSILKQLTYHSKISIDNNDVKAKGYLGYGQTWISNSIKKIAPNTNFSISNAIDKGVAYLIANQQQSGYWRDYLLPPGTSDQWVTAYIANILCILPQSDAKKAANLAWQMLKKSFRENEGWGYSFLTPTDADSSSWTLLLAEKIDSDFLNRNKNILLQYLSENNGVVTYYNKESIKENAQLDKHTSVDGWTAEHLCVSAVTAQILAEKILPFLSSKQHEKGYWESYWWTSPIYATYMAIVAYKKASVSIPNEIELKHFVQEEKELFLQHISQNKSCNSYYLSLLICTCMELNEKSDLPILVNHVIAQICPDGEWKGCSELRVPKPEITHPKAKEDYFIVNDHNNLFTTASVVKMLHQYQQHEIQPI
jgi:hypothetical protein